MEQKIGMGLVRIVLVKEVSIPMDKSAFPALSHVLHANQPLNA